MRKAFTLIELLIVLVITLLLLSAIYLGYISLFKNFLKQTTISTVQIESSVGLEVLRQDVEHAGYGIGLNESTLPIRTEVDSSGSYHLKIHSTYNTSNDQTRGWALVNCTGIGMPPDQLAPDSSSEPFPSNKAVFMDLTGDVVNGYTNFACPDAGYYLAYPVPKIRLRSGEKFVCTNQACVEIEYYLYNTSSKNPLCPDLPSLGRKVSWKVRNGRTVGHLYPILDCVADFKVRYDWGNRAYVDPVTDSAIVGASSADERENLKVVHIYLLIREGKYDPNYTFTGNTSIDGVNLNLPSSPDSLHYRWKVIKLSIEPMNLIK
ncbi:type IV pilus assembly protein PilW [Thermovibrio guaymasensis]|uniref:Type IV pilus assembly protein PilW n=1 Tax=Thermovibrio guaymasensis TaxID=240167 RepID=A0A420W9K3_9BACT|nr:prepilin-type N-terminal cleavage/methylation domain-containing protein [Thermovibrio guaymasensis]RKQ64013.1 type IV pilus assembly protein PilW [Thermovibrio guaymasensis]